MPSGTRLLGVSIDRSMATVDLTSEYQAGGGSLSMQLRLGQVVYTLTQFPTIKSVRFQLDGAPVNVFSSEGIVLDHPVGRSAYKQLAPNAAPVAGTWRLLPRAPLAVEQGPTGAWTGSQLIVFGRHEITARDVRGNPYIVKSVDVAAAYDPAADAWHRLALPAGPGYNPNDSAVWTGSKLLVFGPLGSVAFDPKSDKWQPLARGLQGLVVWTGHEAIGWGGGCCGDIISTGDAYDPATNAWRRLPKSPLAGSQHPIGAWTGRELVLFGDTRSAAYVPATNAWRTIAPIPAPRDGANVVWDGTEVLVVGGGAAGGRQLPASGFAYDPATNRWRRLPPMESGRAGAAAVWTGKRLLLWGGGTGRAGSLVAPPHGLAYDPQTNAWSPLPQAPLQGRLNPAAAWTGHALIVWGGSRFGAGKPFADGAAFTPATP